MVLYHGQNTFAVRNNNISKAVKSEPKEIKYTT